MTAKSRSKSSKPPKLGPNQEKFVRMLETTRKTQITGSLYGEGQTIGKKHTMYSRGFCALGIAGLVAGLSKTQMENEGDLDIEKAWKEKYNMHTASCANKCPIPITAFPERVREDFYYTEDGMISVNCTSIPNMNDKLMMTFKEIATILRAYPEAFFEGPA